MAAMTSVMTSFLTTRRKNSILHPLSLASSSSSSCWALRVSRRRRTDAFRLRSTPTDSNRLLSSKSYPSGASDVVTRFYDGINSRNLSAVVDLIAEDCIYEDLVFPQPFVGRKAILEFFEKFMYTISQDLQFSIDDISGEDTSAVGVTWHLEWKGKPFPFSKGCSFYRLKVVDGRHKIVYGRDIVEPAVKPGDFALVAIRSVTWLLQQFPQLAERF
ncbi:hypothetical protein SSX86_016472 [Deinandra increscens subsp. villosa]|uniref:SnoaL-like domain-containing protein n=1 Tax=Deinandra increscens subsp. villosa TaxID=3103831 RepID=A0AAP0CY58_9ASTR